MGITRLKRRFRRLTLLIGPGLISAVAGLEITNIGVFTYAGSKYGYSILWAIIFSMLVTGFMQQLAAEVGVESRKGLVTLVGRNYGKTLLYIFIFSLIISNITTAALNFAGSGMAIEALTGIPWPICAFIVGSTSLILASTRAYSRVEKFLTLIALSLSSYVILSLYYMVIEPRDILEILKGSIVPSGSFDKVFVVDLLSILGASAAAYSLVFQAAGVVYEEIEYEDLPREFENIMVGVFLTTIASISIAVTASSHLHSKGVVVSTVHEAIKSLDAVGPLAPLLFAVGSTSSALLAVEAIILCNSYLVYELKTGRVVLKEAVEEREYNLSTLSTVVSSLAISLLYGWFLGFSERSFVEMGRWLSVVISLTSWPTALVITALYWRVKVFTHSFLRVAGGFLAVLIVVVNVLGVLWVLKP